MNCITFSRAFLVRQIVGFEKEEFQVSEIDINAAMGNPDYLWSVRELVRTRLSDQVRESTINRWLWSGALKRTKVGGKTFIREGDFRLFIEASGKSNKQLGGPGRPRKSGRPRVSKRRKGATQ